MEILSDNFDTGPTPQEYVIQIGTVDSSATETAPVNTAEVATGNALAPEAPTTTEECGVYPPGNCPPPSTTQPEYTTTTSTLPSWIPETGSSVGMPVRLGALTLCAGLGAAVVARRKKIQPTQ